MKRQFRMFAAVAVTVLVLAPPLLEDVALRRAAEEEPALAPRLDERRELPLADAPRQLQVALDLPGRAVQDMIAAGGRLLDHQFGEERGVHLLHPRLEQLAVVVEVHALEVARHRAGDDADAVLPVREPRLHLNLRRQTLRPGLPAADGGMLLRPLGGKTAESGVQVADGCLD